MTPKYEPLRIGSELREELSSAVRKLGFFLGAGCSISAGIPGLGQLTKSIEAKVPDNLRPIYQALATQAGQEGLEWILSRVRLIRELVGTNVKDGADGISGEQAVSLDRAICKAVLEIVSSSGNDISDYKSLSSWIRQIDRENPVEIFTTNYDLLIESAFEAVEAPYFDGFVGVVEPFFVAEGVEAHYRKSSSRNCPPTSWTRLWKLHGSVGWQLSQSAGGLPRVVRRAVEKLDLGSELLIYPSRDKYMATRKLPFLMYLDRLREFLSSGEVLLVVCGYSLHDEHITYVLTQGLRANARAAVHVFFFEPIPKTANDIATTYRNMTLFGPDSAVIGGVHEGWLKASRAKAPGEDWTFGMRPKVSSL